MSQSIPFGKKDNKLILASSLSDDDRGLKCNCVCPSCHMPLEFIKSIDKRPHFRHKGNIQHCHFDPRLYIKQIISSLLNGESHIESLQLNRDDYKYASITSNNDEYYIIDDENKYHYTYNNDSSITMYIGNNQYTIGIDNPTYPYNIYTDTLVDHVNDKNIDEKSILSYIVNEILNEVNKQEYIKQQEQYKKELKIKEQIQLFEEETKKEFPDLFIKDQQLHVPCPSCHTYHLYSYKTYTGHVYYCEECGFKSWEV